MITPLVSEMIDVLKKKAKHYECEDCWYSCSTISCNDNRGDKCDCGAQEVIDLLAKMGVEL